MYLMSIMILFLLSYDMRARFSYVMRIVQVDPAIEVVDLISWSRIRELYSLIIY